MATGQGRPAEQAWPAEEHLAAAPPPMFARWRRLSILGVGAAVVAADQASKTWALHHAVEPVLVVWRFRLAVTFNRGTAFGLGRGSTGLIVGGVVVLVVVLLGLGRRASRTANWPASLAMGLLLGGAMGNLADRLLRHHQGAVIDFIDLHWWPVFNVADAAISVGAFLLALVLFRARPVPLGRRLGSSGGSSPGTAPGSSAPGSSAPGSSAPGSSAPGSSAGTAPQ